MSFPRHFQAGGQPSRAPKQATLVSGQNSVHLQPLSGTATGPEPSCSYWALLRGSPPWGQQQAGSLPPLCTSPTAHTPRRRRFTCREPCSSTKAALSSLWEFAAESSAGTKGFHRHIPSRRPASLPPGVPASCHSSTRPRGRSSKQTPSAGFWEWGQSIPGAGHAPAASRLLLHPSGSRAGGGSSPPSLPPRPKASR